MSDGVIRSDGDVGRLVMASLVPSSADVVDVANRVRVEGPGAESSGEMTDALVMVREAALRAASDAQILANDLQEKVLEAVEALQREDEAAAALVAAIENVIDVVGELEGPVDDSEGALNSRSDP